MPDPIGIGDVIAYVRSRTTEELKLIIQEIAEELGDRIVPNDDPVTTMRGGIRPTNISNPL